MGGYLWSVLISLSVTIQTFRCRNIDVGDCGVIPQPLVGLEHTERAPHHLPEESEAIGLQIRAWTAVGLFL